MELVQQLPAVGRHLQIHTDLPAATLGSIVGEGQTLEVADKAIWLNGQALAGSLAQQKLALRQHFERLADTSQPVYIAAARLLLLDRLRDVLTALPQSVKLHLLFAAPQISNIAPREGNSEATGVAASLTQRLIEQRDPVLRKQLIQQAYQQYAQCPAVHAAVQSVDKVAPAVRWQKLRTALLAALPQCNCSSLDREHFGQLLVSEQRAGAGTLGSVPVDFLRDERCGASIPRQSTQWLMKEIEQFDEEFSGQYRGEAMRFDKVVTNDRLLRVMCPALPGETLAALQRKEYTMYWKLPNAEPGSLHPCQGWKFDALEKGSPMGNWRPVIGSASAPSPPPIHFWQGAEEIRLYGPMKSANSKATEDGPWSCSQEFRMVDQNADSIQLEKGRWFYSRAACEASTSTQDVLRGCIADLALGKPLPAPPEQNATAAQSAADEAINSTATTDPGNAGQ